MKKNNYFSIDFIDDKFIFLDQTKLPLTEEYIKTEDYNRIAEAIERLEIRGAPAIGVAAAYGLTLALKGIPKNFVNEKFEAAYQRLSKTRPTAVNLFRSLEDLKKVYEDNKDTDNIYLILKSEAENIHKDDIEKCRLIGENGLGIFKKNKSNVLTHCNTGKLATSGDGTAFNVIKRAFEKDLIKFVYADETRPLLQGLRLTAFELEKNGIPFAVLTDSSAASLMQQNKVDLVVVGADRIAINGDTANKIGTYSLAVLCYHHNVPFYIAAPTTTIDRTIPSGQEIVIEERKGIELTRVNGNIIAPESYNAYTPAFDVTPSHLITGIITEDQVYSFPYNFIQ
ncbi:MAG: S-methyl-5-thioribose-1-phosphate isomerase [Ignavibacteriaceae bacterium]